MLATMPHPLEEVMTQRIAAGLKRTSIESCSQWACTYRVMGKPFPGKWSFEHHPWSREMHDCSSEIMVGQKAAQMGFTETALNKTFYAIDIGGDSVLYVLPASTPDASDFSKSRFDPALELSAHLKNLFSNVKNIHHKRAGSANLFVRGSRSRSQMKSVPVALIIFDEFDEMNQDNVSLAEERIEGQQAKDQQIYKISTPTIDNHGINVDYKVSTQEHYCFRCPHCNRYIMLTLDNLVIVGESEADPRIRDSYVVCSECKHKLDHETKVNWIKDKKAGGTGMWVPDYTDRFIRGFQIPQFYSTTVHPYKIAIKVFKAQHNPADEQELYNSKLGMTHVVEGAKVTDNDITECTGDYTKCSVGTPNAMITMGIDVGKWLHYEIDQWFFKGHSTDINLAATVRVLREGKVENFEELDNLMMDFRVRFCVIDANPERRKALEFAQRFWGRVRLCFYGNAINGKQIHLHAEEEHTLTVDRTSWLDLSLGRFHSRTITLPLDASREYKEHIKAPVRIYRADSNKNPVGKYVTGTSEEDHFAHARNYAEIALPLGANLAKSKDIGEIM